MKKKKAIPLSINYKILLRATPAKHRHNRRNVVISNHPLWLRREEPGVKLPKAYKPELKVFVNEAARRIIASLRKHKIPYKAEITRYTPCRFSWTDKKWLADGSRQYLLSLTSKDTIENYL